jgi:hypothetical protein
MRQLLMALAISLILPNAQANSGLGMSASGAFGLSTGGNLGLNYGTYPFPNVGYPFMTSYPSGGLGQSPFNFAGPQFRPACGQSVYGPPMGGMSGCPYSSPYATPWANANLFASFRLNPAPFYNPFPCNICAIASVPQRCTPICYGRNTVRERRPIESPRRRVDVPEPRQEPTPTLAPIPSTRGPLPIGLPPVVVSPPRPLEPIPSTHYPVDPSIQPPKIDPTEPLPPSEQRDDCNTYRGDSKATTEACTACAEGQEQSGGGGIPGLISSVVSDAARNVMATQYQSCDVVEERAVLCPGDVVEGYTQGDKTTDRRVTNLDKILDTQHYLKTLRAKKPNFCKEAAVCAPVCEKPPVFRYGGKPTLSKAGEMNVHSTTGATSETKISGLDCSGFVSAALRAAGLKFKTNASTLNFATLAMGDFGKSSQDCLQPAQFTADAAMVSGDIIVWPGDPGHAMIVESTGTDPFGIQKIMNKEDQTKKRDESYCLGDSFQSQVNAQDFDFKLIMSGTPNGEGVGTLRVRAKDYFSNEKYDKRFGSYMKELAVKACKAKLGKPQDGVIEKQRREFVVLRHESLSKNKRPGRTCTIAKPTLKCGKDCSGK